MITDGLMAMLLGLYQGLVNLLPVMPDRPEAFDQVLSLFQVAIWILPISDLNAFTPLFVSTLGLLVVVRLVRFLLPGG